MRINPDTSTGLLNMLAMSRKQQDTSLRELSSGRRVQAPSDDPAACAAASQNHQAQSQVDQFLQSIGSVRELLSSADSALNSVVQALQRAVTLGVEGANGTQSAENRKSLAQEVRGIRDQVLSLANLSFRGSYVFAGTNVKTQPFAEDAAVPSGIRYDGNSQVNDVEIGEHRTISVGVPGDQLFADPAAGVFTALESLATALEQNDVDSVSGAATQVRAALEHVSTIRVTYGNGLNQLDSDERFLDQSQLQLKTREEELVGADSAEAITRLQQAQFARDATLAAAARTQSVSLLDYLR